MYFLMKRHVNLLPPPVESFQTLSWLAMTRLMWFLNKFKCVLPAKHGKRVCKLNRQLSPVTEAYESREKSFIDTPKGAKKGIDVRKLEWMGKRNVCSPSGSRAEKWLSEFIKTLPAGRSIDRTLTIGLCAVSLKQLPCVDISEALGKVNGDDERPVNWIIQTKGVGKSIAQKPDKSKAREKQTFLI